MAPTPSSNISASANTAPSFNPDRPWEGLPNPFGFPPLSEAAKSVYQYPSSLLNSLGYVSNAGKKPSKSRPQRSSSVGRDWLGTGFQRGDLLLVASGNTLSVFKADEIFLDDASGAPYLHRSGGLVIHKPTGDIFQANKDWTGGSGKIILTPVDPTWIGTNLGLVAMGRDVNGLSDDFELLGFQSFKVRAEPFGDSNNTAKRSFPQEHVTVYGSALSEDEVERKMLSRNTPLLKNLAAKF